MYKSIELYDDIPCHLIDITNQPDINRVRYNYCTILTAVAAIGVVTIIFALFITGTLCSLSGENESIECHSANHIFNIFKTIIGIGLFN